MRRITWIYIFGVILTAGLLTVAAFITRPTQPSSEMLFLALTVTTALLLMSVVISPNRQAYEGSAIALMAGVLLLPPGLFALQTIIAHTIEWLWFRLRSPGDAHLRAWYIQPFNTAKCIIAGITAHVILRLAPAELSTSFSTEYLIIIFASIIAFVGINQLLLGLALSLARGVSFRDAGILRDAILIEVPLACIGYVAAVLMSNSPLAALFVLAPITLIYQAFILPKTQAEAMQALESVNRDLTKANQSIHQLNEELFLTLAKIFDARDPYVGGHAAQVAAYAIAIAEELKLPAERVEVIRQSAYLHDIGKIAIPESILHKPDRLTDAEYELVKKHTDIGADFIATSHGLRHLVSFIRYHHERWDGRGYPLGLAGEAIPLEARILNVCDSVEAMASDRPYHHALTAAEIIAELRRCTGSQFDPVIVEAFTSIVERRTADLIVNSARTVAGQHIVGDMESRNLSGELFKQIYHAASA